MEFGSQIWNSLRLSVCAGLSISVWLIAVPVHAQQQDDDVTRLDTVVVEEQGEPQARQPLGIGISGKTLTTAPGSAGDAMRTLQSLPGMSFTDDESPLPAVRGSRPGDNYFQVDFVPAGYLFHAGGLISVFNSDLVKSFDIYPSAYGPEYTGITGGVFDIALRDPATDRFRTSLDVSFLHAGALIEGPLSDNQSFYLAGRFSYLDLLIADQLDDDEGVTIDQIPKYTDYQAKYVWEPKENSKLTVQLTGADDVADVRVDRNYEEIATDPDLAGRFYEKTAYAEQALLFDQKLDNGIELKSALSHRSSTDVGEFGGAGEVDVDGAGFFAKSRASMALNESHDLTVGAELSKTTADINVSFKLPNCSEFSADCRVTGAERRDIKEKIKVNGYSAYIKDSWYVSDKLTLIPGLALFGDNYFDGNFVEPRFALEYAVSDDLILSAGTGIYHQFPDYLETTEAFGNPALRYAESVHGVFGIQKLFGRKWDIKTEFHYKKLDKLSTDDDILNYINGGDGYAYGMDLLVRRNLTDKFSGWLSLSVSEARRRRKSTGQSFPFEFDQPVNMSLVGNYEISKKWSVGAKVWVHSGSTYTEVLGATEDEDTPGLYNPQYGAINAKRFPMYQRVDVRIDRTFSRKKGRTMGAYFEILNLLDNRNTAGFDYSADYTSKKESTQLPQILALGFKATF